MGVPRTRIEAGPVPADIQVHVENGRARGSLSLALVIPGRDASVLAQALHDLHDPQGPADLDTRLGRMAGRAPQGSAFLIGLEDQAWVLPSDRIEIRRFRDGEPESLDEPQVVRLRPGDRITLKQAGDGPPLAEARVMEAPAPNPIVVEDASLSPMPAAPASPSRSAAPRKKRGLSRPASVALASVVIAAIVAGTQLFGRSSEPEASAYVAPTLEQRVVDLLTFGSSSRSSEKSVPPEEADTEAGSAEAVEEALAEAPEASPNQGAETRTDEGGDPAAEDPGDETPQVASAAVSTPGTPWEFRTEGAITSSPLLTDGRIVFGCRDHHLYCLDAESGEALWTLPARSGIGSSPLRVGNRIVVGTYGGELVAVNLADGTVAWETTLGARVVSSPCRVGDRIVVGAYDGKVHAVDAESGTPVWSVDTGAPVRASGERVGDAVGIGSGNGRFLVISAKNGGLVWERNYPKAVHAQAAWDEASGRLWLATQDGTVECLDAATGKVRWSARLPSEVNARPILAGDRLIIGTGQGTLHALSAQDGAELWNATADRGFDARPVVRDRVVLAPSFDGTLHRLALEDGRVLDRRAVGAEVFSSPAASEDRLYLGTMDGTFLALALP